MEVIKKIQRVIAGRLRPPTPESNRLININYLLHRVTIYNGFRRGLPTPIGPGLMNGILGLTQ